MWDIIGVFVEKVSETVIDILELGAITGIGALFFMGIGYLWGKAKALFE